MCVQSFQRSYLSSLHFVNMEILACYMLKMLYNQRKKFCYLILVHTRKCRSIKKQNILFYKLSFLFLSKSFISKHCHQVFASVANQGEHSYYHPLRNVLFILSYEIIECIWRRRISQAKSTSVWHNRTKIWE